MPTEHAARAWQVSLNERTGALHVAGRDWALRDWGVAIEADGAIRRGAPAGTEWHEDGTFCVRYRFVDLALEWTLHARPGAGSLVVASTLRNCSEGPIALGKAWVMHDAVPERLAGPSDDLVCLGLTGSLSTRPVRRVDEDETPTTSKVKFQFYNRTQNRAFQVGFLTFRRADTEVEFDYEPGQGLTGLRAFCDFAGWELGPGAETPVERFILAVGADPGAQLVAWADSAAALCHARDWEDAPIGWLGWAWLDPFTADETYQDIVLRNCTAIRERLHGFGVDYVWVSIGNIDGGYPGNWLNWNAAAFPDGPEFLAARLHEMGFRWGLWCAVFYLCSALEETVAAFDDALLRDADGARLVVQAEWRYGEGGTVPAGQRPCVYALDPSHPTTHAWLKDTFETYRRWGVRYYMIDFLEAGAGLTSRYPYAAHHDRSLVAGPEAYHRALSVVRDAAGDDTYFLSSSGPSIHNAGMVDAARVGNDFGEGRSIMPGCWFYPATSAINRTGEWNPARRALINQATAWYTHRRLYINDSGNVLTVDKPLSLSDARIHATIHALSGAGSMIGDDVGGMDTERLALVKKTLPRPRHVAVPIDLWDAVAPDYPKLFHRRIDAPWGRFDVVAVYNMDEEPLTQTIEMGALGLSPEADILAWEFWNEEYIGRVSTRFTAYVAPRSVRVFRLVEDTGAPALIGTDMHVTMGEMEIQQCRWDSATLTLAGRALRPAGERGSVFIWAPPGLAVVNASGHGLAKDVRDDALIIRVALDFADGLAEWELRFTAHDVPGTVLL
ncbi:MAG: hypothetical protein JXR94_23010 [Candidatus Hydrogenedentes bacterium]|nr:hypothetical protein [Candidatus Hydrogenedentota bacterium]